MTVRYHHRHTLKGYGGYGGNFRTRNSHNWDMTVVFTYTGCIFIIKTKRCQG